jgi:hypothetical protein
LPVQGRRVEYFLYGLLGLLGTPAGDASDDGGIAKLLADAVHCAFGVGRAAVELLENGISRALVLDYNDFVISGAMGKFDVRDSKPCK